MARRSTATPGGGGGGGGTPAWLSGVAVNQWVEIPGSSMSLMPGLTGTTPATQVAGRMDAYNGFGLRNTAVWSIATGGHTDYFGNEVGAIDFNADAPAWSLVLGWSTVAQSGLSTGTSYHRYSDNRPASSHRYGHIRYVPQWDKFVTVGNTSTAVNGGSVNKCVVYDPVANEFLPDNTVPDCAPIVIADNTVFDDPETGDIYHSLGGTLYRWTRATNTWSTVTALSQFYGVQGVGCLDTTRRRALMLGGSDPANRVPKVFDLTTQTAADITMSGDTTIVGTGRFGLVYCPATDRFYAMTGTAPNGAGLFEIHPTTWAISVPSVTGATGMPADPSTELGNGSGVYTRFLYIASLGGCVYFPRHSANAWFLRLH